MSLYIYDIVKLLKFVHMSMKGFLAGQRDILKPSASGYMSLIVNLDLDVRRTLESALVC